MHHASFPCIGGMWRRAFVGAGDGSDCDCDCVFLELFEGWLAGWLAGLGDLRQRGIALRSRIPDSQTAFSESHQIVRFQRPQIASPLQVLANQAGHEGPLETSPKLHAPRYGFSVVPEVSGEREEWHRMRSSLRKERLKPIEKFRERSQLLGTFMQGPTNPLNSIRKGRRVIVIGPFAPVGGQQRGPTTVCLTLGSRNALGVQVLPRHAKLGVGRLIAAICEIYSIPHKNRMSASPIPTNHTRRLGRVNSTNSEPLQSSYNGVKRRHRKP